MTSSTHRLLEDLLRLAKSAVAIGERWLKEQSIDESVR